MARPFRVVILAVERPFVHRQGSSTYLDHLARSLRLIGAEPHLRILQPPNPGQMRLSLEPDFLAPFASVALHRAFRRGARFYARSPSNWLGRFLPKAPPGGVGGAGSGPWSLLRPAPDAVAWAAAEVGRLAPAWVIGNYFNAAEAFAALPRCGAGDGAGGPSTAILTHDVFALRRDSLAALGRPPDFDEGMIPREAAAFRAVDLVLAIKPEEAAHVAATAPGTATATLPFAVDAPAQDLATPRPPVALFVGAVNPPNVDALGWLISDIWPRVRALHPAARLRVAGRVAESRPGPWPEGAEAVGFVPDLAPEYAGAAVVLAPVRFGSGVKIKLVEGLAHGLPGVATPEGAEGLGPLPAPVLQVAADAEGFAAAVVRALADPDAAATRARARTEATARWSRPAVARGLAAALGVADRGAGE